MTGASGGGETLASHIRFLTSVLRGKVPPRSRESLAPRWMGEPAILPLRLAVGLVLDTATASAMHTSEPVDELLASISELRATAAELDVLPERGPRTSS